MMALDEVVLRANLGSQLVPGHVVVGQFGPSRRLRSLVAISQTLDKLLVYELSSSESSSVGANMAADVYYIAIRDVIRSVAVRWCDESAGGETETIGAGPDDGQQVKATDEQVNGRDLLLVGCSNSVLIYDLHHRNNLFSVATAAAISVITNDLPLNLFDLKANTYANASRLPSLTICASLHKIYALRIDAGPKQHEFGQPKAELTSERSASGDTITCLIQGYLGGYFEDLVVAGTLEHKIRIYPLDPFDLNIQTCRLTIEETSKVNCLCAINTISSPNKADSENKQPMKTTYKLLPSVDEMAKTRLEKQETPSQMNYFAYGLENGFIGVYQLFQQQSKTNESTNGGGRLSAERLWRHKCKHSPVALLMYDINGDGLDELLVGFRNSRIEARLPFTGQLLATTRCFKSDQLAGLLLVPTTASCGPKSRPLLLACATSGALNGYQSRGDLTRAPRPLQGYGGGGAQDSSSLGELEWSLKAATGTNLKTIEEEQQSADVSMATEREDLHIELESDAITASRCDARQSHELLLRLNGLQSQQLELERRLCQLYHRNLCSPKTQKLAAESTISISHRWDFDLVSHCLKLSIVIIANQRAAKQVRLIDLGDESRNFVESGHLLVSSDEFSAGSAHNPTTAAKRRLVVVVPLRARRNLAAQLELRLFAESSFGETLATSGEARSQPTLAQMFSAHIDVPTFAMLVPAESDAANELKPAIKTTFRMLDWVGATEILDWLHESFLCLHFGRLIESHQGANPLEAERASTGDGEAQIMMDDSGGFRLNLLDLRETGRTRHELPAKLAAASPPPPYSARTLRIAYSNAGDSAASLTLECDSSDLMAEIVQSLVIDRLHLEISACLEDTKLDAVRDELNRLVSETRQVEESEKRIQSELYESADYTQNLMQQLAIANELEEYSAAKELLNELYMMLCGAQNAARGQCLNGRSRLQLSKQVEELRLRLDLLTGKG